MVIAGTTFGIIMLYIVVLLNVLILFLPYSYAAPQGFDLEPEDRRNHRRRGPCAFRRGTRKDNQGRTFLDWSFQHLDINYNHNYNIDCSGGNRPGLLGGGSHHSGGGGLLGGNHHGGVGDLLGGSHHGSNHHGSNHHSSNNHGSNHHGGNHHNQGGGGLFGGSGLVGQAIGSLLGGNNGPPIDDGGPISQSQSQSHSQGGIFNSEAATSNFQNGPNRPILAGVGSLLEGIPNGPIAQGVGSIGQSVGSLIGSFGSLFQNIGPTQAQAITSAFNNAGGFFGGLINNRPSPGGLGSPGVNPASSNNPLITPASPDIIYNDERPINENHDDVVPDLYNNLRPGGYHNNAYNRLPYYSGYRGY